MTAVLLTPLFETMLDNNGVPLAGGSITSYTAGTTTPLATYTDASGTVAAANPIPLDSAGRISNGGVWGSGVYKFILKNSAGTTISTVDNVTAIYGSGDMTKAIYDPTNIAQQLVGTTAVQTISNKTFDGTNTFSGISSGKIQPISASVAANALTISSLTLSLDFRSTTLGSGTVITVTGTPSNLIIPSTATLGTVNAIQSRLVVLALNNAGTIELAVVNISGGNDLTETGVISTTAISAAATAANVIYSTTARTGVVYRVIGYVESTQATAGTWATAPSTIQGAGGQALTAMSSLGYGQIWQSVVRTTGVTYYNTTGRPIVVKAEATSSGTGNNGTLISISGSSVGRLAYGYAGVVGTLSTGSIIVPPNVSYVLTDDTSTHVTYELR